MVCVSQPAQELGTNKCLTFFLLTSFVSVSSISYNNTRNYLIKRKKKGVASSIFVDLTPAAVFESLAFVVLNEG